MNTKRLIAAVLLLAIIVSGLAIVLSAEVASAQDASTAPGAIMPPRAPTINKVTTTTNTATVFWTPPTDNGGSPVMYYRIFWGTSSGSTTNSALQSASAPNSYTATGLTPRTTYFFMVQAINSVGSGHASNSVSGTTKDVAPGPVNDLLANPDILFVDLSWTLPTPNGGSPVDYYAYAVSTDPDPSMYYAIPGTSERVEGLSPSTHYYVVVYAHNAAGYGPASTTEFTTDANIAPDEPEITLLTPHVNSVDAYWDAPEPNGGTSVTGYRVYWGTAPNPHDAFRSILVGTTTEATITGLSPATRYYFAVEAINAVGPGEVSDSADVTTLNIVPNAPLMVSAVALTDLDVTVTWEAPASNGGTSITGYKIFYGTEENPDDDFVVAGPTATFTTISGLTNEVWYFNVVAVNAQGDGAPSADASATPDTYPAAPSGLHANTVRVNSVTLHWSAPAASGGSAVTGYRVFYGTSTGPTNYVDFMSTGTIQTIYGLDANTVYYFDVAAINAVGAGPKAGEIFRTTGNTAPQVPSSVDPTSYSNYVTVTWTAPAWGDDIGSPITSYDVRYRRQTGSVVGIPTWSSWTQVNLGTVLYSYTTPTLGSTTTTYWFEVRAVNAAGAGPWYNDNPISWKGVQADAYPSAPTWGSATPHLNSVSLSWSAGSAYYGTPIDHYNIYYGTEDNPTAYYGHSHSTSGTVSGLLANTLYYFRVTAVNDKGEGAFSDSISATTTNVVPGVPSFSLSTGDDGSAIWVRVSITLPTANGGSPVTYYDVYVGTSNPPSFFNEIPVDWHGEVMVGGWLPDQLYYVQVSARNALGEGAKATVQSITTPDRLPSAPTMVSATPGLNDVSLVWTAPESYGGTAVTDYRLYWGTSPNPSNIVNSILMGSTGLTYDMTGLSPGTLYYFNVAAINAMGEGPQSADISATTLDKVPDAPHIFDADVTRTSLTIYWTPAAPNGGTPVLYFRIYYGTSPSPSVNSILAAATDISATITGLTPGTKYYFNMVAVNSMGASLLSNEEFDTTMPDIVQNAPIPTYIEAYDVGVYMTWTPGADTGGSPTTSWKVYYGTSPNPTVSFVSIPLERTYINMGGLSCGTQYYLNVVAVNGAGDSAHSTDMSATTNRVPGAPTGVYATAGVDNDVTVHWTAPTPNGGTPVTSFRIYYDTTPNPTAYFDTGLSTDTSRTISGLTPGITWYFKVLAINDLGQGPASSDATAVPNKVPNAPVIGTATPGVGQATVTWTDGGWNGGSAILWYRVYYGTSAAPDTYFADAGAFDTSRTITGLTPGTTYYFNVVAYNNVYHSAPSSDASCTVPIGSRSITVISPNGGEVWKVGSKHLIQWSSNDVPADFSVRIELWKGGIYYSTISASTENDGSYLWTTMARAGNDYRIVIILLADTSIRDSSNGNFVVSSAFGVRMPELPMVTGPVAAVQYAVPEALARIW